MGLDHYRMGRKDHVSAPLEKSSFDGAAILPRCAALQQISASADERSYVAAYPSRSGDSRADEGRRGEHGIGRGQPCSYSIR